MKRLLEWKIMNSTAGIIDSTSNLQESAEPSIVEDITLYKNLWD